MELALVLDPGERFGRRLVVGGLEDAAKQDRNIFELHVRALFDRGDRLVAEKGVGAAEVEQELRIGAHGGLPMCLRYSGARQAARPQYYDGHNIAGTCRLPDRCRARRWIAATAARCDR